MNRLRLAEVRHLTMHDVRLQPVMQRHPAPQEEGVVSSELALEAFCAVEPPFDSACNSLQHAYHKSPSAMSDNLCVAEIVNVIVDC